MTLTRILFDIGETFATPTVLAALDASEEDPYLYLGRHITGDWGTISAVDAAANMLSLVTAGQILSSYRTVLGVTFLIATLGDRSKTYLFLYEDCPPEDADEPVSNPPHARPGDAPSACGAL